MTRVLDWCVRASVHLLIACAFVPAAAAQTTVTLSQPDTHVVYATVRGGSFANINLDTILQTRASSNLEYLRRALLKFDTHNRIPAGASVTSAVLTVTVKSGSEDASRRIGVYQVRSSWAESEVTWKQRRTATYWGTAGGDLGTKIAEQVAGNAAGARVSFDVTPLVRQAVSGALGSSRYTRVALVDLDGSTSASWREYHTPDDPNTAVRPTLKVVYGGSTSTGTSSSSSPSPSTSTSTGGKLLRVLEYNVHHNGHGTDGVYSPNRVATWIAKINPDVAVLVEIEKYTSWSQNTDGVAVYKSLVESKTGVRWYAWDAQNYGDWTSNGLRTLILSKLPFISTFRKEYSVGRDRSVGGVTVSVNGRNINIFGTHFDPYSGSNRQVQARELVAYMSGFAEDRIVMGDFNEQAGNLTTITSKYYDAWVEAKRLGIAYSAPDNPNGYTRRSRIDYVFYSRGERWLTLKKVQVVDTRDANGYMPSDHRPLVAEFLVN
jgi:endonuclease/exonuclease/phosphatase family metal-dependent hydrolase